MSESKRWTVTVESEVLGYISTVEVEAETEMQALEEGARAVQGGAFDQELCEYIRENEFEAKPLKAEPI